MLNLTEIVQQIDTFFARNMGAEAEKLMKESIVQAVKEEDDNALLTLLNELIGYYRETSQVEASYRLADQALVLLGQMGLEGTIPYATTLLNIANAYRAGGRLADSLRCYEKTMEIYRVQLAPEDMLVASLYNNMSLLYQEKKEFNMAKSCLLKALQIVSCHEEAYFELAVTYANLAATCLTLNEDEEAKGYFEQAIQLFEAHSIEDAHYSAALSSLGTYYFKKGKYARAAVYFQKAMECMRKSLGENEYYSRLKENLEACEKALNLETIELCRRYFEEFGAPMLHEQFPEYEDKIAVGLVGEGSDCFGYDDALSRDHDWGPDFCLWVTEEIYAKIGEQLKEAYAKLPTEYMGYQRTVTPQGSGRRGVQTINSFYSRLLGQRDWEKMGSQTEGIAASDHGTGLRGAFWQQAPDAALAASVNGGVFRDDLGIFSKVRLLLKAGYPQNIQYLKLAQSAALFAQTGQYNYSRMLQRKDKVAAQMMLGDCLKEAARLCYYMENKYPPHDKWLVKGLEQLQDGKEIAELMQQAVESKESSATGIIEALAEKLVLKLYRAGFISDTDPYLDNHTSELLQKAQAAAGTDSDLIEKIIELEFAAFDKVRNVGGRASCQDDWFTFSIMRRSQYQTWNRSMLLQFLYDFDRELSLGHNLIEEKYGRMMESTAPAEYERIKEHFPKLSDQKKSIVESVVEVQVAWMEEFEAQYPTLAGNARSIHTSEDHLYNTSYETYLRGEISTYSDKMLELYGRYVVEYAQKGENLARAIMTNSVVMYGYHSLDEAEEQMSRLRVKE